jgi:hypothetical protein
MFTLFAVGSASHCTPPTCFDYQCQGPDPRGQYECNTQPCPVYTWSVSEWSTCTSACDGGTRVRTVSCVEGSSSNATNSKPVAASLCQGQQAPPTQEACNTYPCEELPLAWLPLPDDDVRVAGNSTVTLSWAGGRLYSDVNLLLQRLTSDLAGRVPVDAPEWVAGAHGLSATVLNTGQVNWTLPASMPPGQYQVMLVSATSPGNNATTAVALRVTGPISYRLVLAGANGGQGFNTTVAVQVVVQGWDQSLNSGPMQLQLPPAGSAPVAQASLLGLDVGVVQAVAVYVPAGQVLTARALGLIAPGMTSAAVFAMPAAQLQGEAQLSACEAYSTSCYTCTEVPGCGWCGASGRCMAANPAGGGPAVGDCPASNWQPTSGSCQDPCNRLRGCDACVVVVGCGWCKSSCSCASTAVDASRPMVGTCAADWMGVVPSGGTCPAGADAACPARLSSPVHPLWFWMQVPAGAVAPCCCLPMAPPHVRAVGTWTVGRWGLVRRLVAWRSVCAGMGGQGPAASNRLALVLGSHAQAMACVYLLAGLLHVLASRRTKERTVHSSHHHPLP